MALRRLALYLGILALAPAVARAEEEVAKAPACDQSGREHILNGHNFLPILTIAAPFVDTETSMAIAGGYGDYPADLFGLGDNLKIATFEPLMQFQYAFSPRFALSAGFQVTTTAGVNATSLVAYGASVQSDINAGALFKILETDKWILSVGLRVDFPNYHSLSPLAGTTLYQELASVVTPDFVYPNVSTVWKPSLRFAYAFNPLVGIEALLGVRALSLSQTVENASTANINAGLGVSVDFKQISSVPVGLTANYTRNQIIQANGVNGNIFSFGLYETYWPQAALGAEVGFGDVLGQSSVLFGLSSRFYY